MNLNLDHQLYAIMKRHKLGAYSIERDVTDMGRAATIKVVAGDPADVLAVIEFNAVESTSRDATSDLAREIAVAAGDDGQPISPALYDFIADHAGIDCAIGLRVYDRSLSAA